MNNKEKDISTEFDQPLKYLPFNIELNVHHRLSDNLSDYEKCRLIAIQSALYTEAVFWLLYQFNNMASQSNINIEKDETFSNLSFICLIGIALSSRTSESVDEMDLALADRRSNK